MCFSQPKIPEDNSAAIARQQEDERQARVTEGRRAIDAAFGQFDDNYFNGVEQSALGYYTPQLDDQFEKARKRTTFDLARSGRINTSAGATAFGDLKETDQKNRTAIAERARAAAQGQRSAIDSERSTLMSQLSASADPSAAAASASARASALSAPQTFSPLANLFADVTQTGATLAAANSAGYKPFKTAFSLPSGGSSRVIS